MVSFKVAAAALATTAMMSTEGSAMVQHPKGVVDRVALYKCVSYIEEEIAKAGGHEAGNVEVAVQTPRDPVVLSETYWMAEVPTNIQGQVACDLHGGNVQYPYPWDNPSAGGEGVPVPPVPCQGKTAGDCCLAIRREGQTSLLGGKDANGQCLACFPHQELLVPVPGSGSSGSSPEYKDYTWDGSACVPTTLTLEQVTADDQAKAAGISAAAQALKDFLDAPSPPSCSEFETLLGQLYDASVTLPALPQMIGELSCMVCYEPEQVVFEPTPETTAITDDILANMAEAPVPVSSQPTVVIYTDSDGTIQEVPKLGGTRADDEVTDDCPDESTTTPTTGETGGETPTTGETGGETPTTGGETPTTGDGETTPTTGEGETTPTTGDGETTPTTGDGETPAEPTGPSGAEGWYLPESTSGGDVAGTDESNCFTPATTVSENLEVYQQPAEGHNCHDYSAESDKTSENLDYDIRYVSHTFDSVAEVTRFVYDVCTAQLECEPEGARFLRGGGKTGEDFNSRAAISHVTIGLLGTCGIVGFDMLADDGSPTTDFGEIPEEREYTIGTDPTTCTSGFKFEQGWDIVNEAGCDTQNWCRKLVVDISGDIPVSSYVGAIKASTGYTIFNDLQVPDCSRECV